jgi:hypothetical protein
MEASAEQNMCEYNRLSSPLGSPKLRLTVETNILTASDEVANVHRGSIKDYYITNEKG